MSAFDKQEGGDHYKGLAIQPAEYCQRNRLGFMESCVVKYVTRHGSKNGAADLRKAIHFLELLLELEYPDVPRGTIDVPAHNEHARALTPHAGSHSHTLSIGGAGCPNCGGSHGSGVVCNLMSSRSTLAGIASAVSGINAAVSAMPKV